MDRLRGRGPRAKRLVGKVPYGHWKAATFVAPLRNDAITVPFVLDGRRRSRRPFMRLSIEF